MRIWSEIKTTIVFVTHDMLGAVLLSDKVYLVTMRPSHVFEQVLISAPRPRAESDREVYETYSKISETFYEGAGIES